MRRRIAIKIMQARSDKRLRPHYKRNTVERADAKLRKLGNERVIRVGRHNMRVIMKRIGGGFPGLRHALGLDAP